MSDEEQHLVAGHLPAMKVGGMRVPQHSTKSHGTHAQQESEHVDTLDKNSSKSQEDEDKPQTQTNEVRVPQQNIGQLINGTHVRVQDAFPEEAVRSFHEKPETSRTKEAHSKPKKITTCFQFQPRTANFSR